MKDFIDKHLSDVKFATKKQRKRNLGCVRYIKK